ncbi:MAG: substrate-binding domain-containing protein [Solirubrobacterales bacterium]|nr:substrate-binding domain-containing protein [Solirubrobacterales bacterium]
MSLSTKGPRTVRRIAVLLTVGVAAALIGAGCGSSSSSSAGGSSAGGSSNAAGSSNAGVSEAQQIIAQASQRPTSITVTTPIGKAAPSGKKIVFISCGTSQCQLQGSIIQQAASHLGWTSTTIATDGSPTQVQNAFATALRQNADAVILNAALRSEIGPQLADAKAKNVPMVECCATDPLASPIIYNTSTTEQNAGIAKPLAAEIVADSKGKASTLYVNIPAYTILATLGSSFEQDYKQMCPSCGYATLDVPLTQLANAPNLIVSYLRSHPDVGYVALSVTDALDTGLPAALSAAGLSKVKIVGQGGGPTSFQYLANGQELALFPFDYYDVDYQMVDALARHWSGQPIQLTPPPHWLITKANLPSNHSQLFPDVTDYQAQFLKLWGKS